MNARAASILIAATFATAAVAQSKQPAVVYDAGGKFDKSFNEAAYNGIERFKKETGSRLPRLRDRQRHAARAGVPPDGAARSRPVIAHRLRPRLGAREGGAGIPERRFAIIDSVVDLPNVQSVRVQGPGRLLPGRRARRARQQVGQGRLRRRHGRAADPPLPVRLRARRQARESERRGAGQHDRHHAGRVERPDARRRARARRSSRAASTSSSPRPAAPAPACTRPPRTRASSPSASTATRTTCSPAPC